MMNLRSSLPEAEIVLRDGRTVGCYVSGSGRANFMLLHGLNSFSGTWKKNVATFESLGRVCAPTLPRVNMSGESSFHDAAELLSAVVLELMHLMNFKSATIVGNSMGGLVGINLAANHPDAVDGLILVDSAAIPEVPPASYGQDAAIRDGMVRVDKPVLIVWGENDRILPLALGRALHQAIKGSLFEVIHGAGHIPHLERPDEFNGIVRSFVNSNSKHLCHND